MDIPDIVASQGRYLINRRPTPVYGRDDDSFAKRLWLKLDALATRTVEMRKMKYGAEAAEWPMGHTPPELVEKHRLETERILAQCNGVITTFDRSGDDEGIEEWFKRSSVISRAEKSELGNRKRRWDANPVGTEGEYQPNKDISIGKEEATETESRKRRKISDWYEKRQGDLHSMSTVSTGF